MAFNISYIYEVLDRYSAPLQKIAQVTDRFEQAAARAQNRVRAMGQRMEEAGSKMANFRSAIGAGGIIAGLKAVVGTSSRLEDAMGDVLRVNDFSKQGLAEYSKEMLAFSEKTGKSVEALHAMATEGGKLGVVTEDLKKFVISASWASTAFDTTDEDIAKQIGDIRDKLKWGQGNIEKFLDSTNYLADKTSAAGQDIVAVTGRLSGWYNEFKVPEEVTASMSAFARIAEQSPELAASGMNMAIRSMAKSPAMFKALNADFVGTFRAELDKMANMPEAKRISYMFKVYGDEGARFMQKAVNNRELLDRVLSLGKSEKAVGSMEREFNNVIGRSSASFARFKEVIKNTSAVIGDVIKPTAVALFERLGESIKYVREHIIKTNPQLVKVATAVLALIAGLAGIGVVAGVAISALGAIATLVGAITWPIALAVGAVAALAAVFAYWTSVGHPVIDVLKETGAAVWDAISAIFGMSGAVTGGAGAWDIFLYVLDRVGDALSVVLHAVKFVAQGIRSLAEAVGLLLQGEFSAAWKALEKGGDDMMGSLSDMLSDAGSMVGLVERASRATAPGGPIPSNVSTLAQASATRESGASVNNVAVDGRIRVEAERGSRVTESSITLNRGQNLAYGN